MSADSQFFSDLVCPRCKASLDLVDDGKGLKCRECGRVYPIRDNIPIMMVSEAKVEN